MEHEPNRWLINAFMPGLVKPSGFLGYSVNIGSQRHSLVRRLTRS